MNFQRKVRWRESFCLYSKSRYFALNIWVIADNVECNIYVLMISDWIIRYLWFYTIDAKITWSVNFRLISASSKNAKNKWRGIPERLVWGNLSEVFFYDFFMIQKFLHFITYFGKYLPVDIRNDSMCISCTPKIS